MTEKQQYLLKLFREIDEMCKKHNLRYVMAGGSLIGVARNEGSIPWDDDVDIYMPRDDWNKLVELSDQVLPPNRAFQCEAIPTPSQDMPLQTPVPFTDTRSSGRTRQERSLTY